MLIERIVRIENPKGIHARPSALIVKTAMKYQADIRLDKDGLCANGKNILEILMLAAAHGENVKVTADGPDASEAIEAVIEAMEEEFVENSADYRPIAKESAC